MGTIADSPLGHPAAYAEGHDPALLYPVERSPQRAALGWSVALPVSGSDAWTAWELAWLDGTGRPQVAVGRFEVPCTSPRIVESKSVKLYLTALNNVRFASRAAFAQAVSADLSQATGGAVTLALVMPSEQGKLARARPQGTFIDDAPLQEVAAAPDASALRTTSFEGSETLVCETFRSLCPVTAQPDYATVIVRYRGPRIDHASLLAYLGAFRRHPGFHEHCVERIHADVWARCRPRQLAVEARFTRRGGIDISPFRTTEPSWRAVESATMVQ